MLAISPRETRLESVGAHVAGGDPRQGEEEQAGQQQGRHRHRDRGAQQRPLHPPAHHRARRQRRRLRGFRAALDLVADKGGDAEDQEEEEEDQEGGAYGQRGRGQNFQESDERQPQIVAVTAG